jgi:hypothetical protein
MSAHAQLVAKAKAYDRIRSLMGNVQNGTDTKITLSQDDATLQFVIRVGTQTGFKGLFLGPDLLTTINSAFLGTPRDE